MYLLFVIPNVKKGLTGKSIGTSIYNLAYQPLNVDEVHASIWSNLPILFPFFCSMVVS